MGVSTSPPLFKRIFQHRQGASHCPELPGGRRAYSHRILPVTSDEFESSTLANKKSSLSAPRSAVSLPTSLPCLLPRRRRAAVVRFADVSVRVYEMTTYYPDAAAQSVPEGEETGTAAPATPGSCDSPVWTMDWEYCDYSTKLPINQYEAFHREGCGIRSRTKAQLPRDFERLYRISRSSSKL
jgi:hypothetical protein